MAEQAGSPAGSTSAGDDPRKGGADDRLSRYAAGAEKAAAELAAARGAAGEDALPEDEVVEYDEETGEEIKKPAPAVAAPAAASGAAAPGGEQGAKPAEKPGATPPTQAQQAQQPAASEDEQLDELLSTYRQTAVPPAPAAAGAAPPGPGSAGSHTTTPPSTQAPAGAVPDAATVAAQAAAQLAETFARVLPQPAKPEKELSPEEQELERNRLAVRELARKEAEEIAAPLLRELQEMRRQQAVAARTETIEQAPVFKFLPREQFGPDFEDELNEALLAKVFEVEKTEGKRRLLRPDEVRSVGKKVTDRNMRRIAHVRPARAGAAAQTKPQQAAAQPAAPVKPAPPPVDPGGGAAAPSHAAGGQNGAGRSRFPSRAERIARNAKLLGS